MGSNGNNSGKSGMTAGAMLAGAVCLLALPSAVLAFTANFETSVKEQPIDGIDAGEASGLARAIPMRSLAQGQPFPFTPAGTPNRPDRSVTVAVRVDDQTVRAITVSGKRVEADTSAEGSNLRIAPTAFNLGVSRGYNKFSQDLVQPSAISGNEIPDLARFSIAPGKSSADSRFSPRIVMDEAPGAGRLPRTYAGDKDDRVDVGGSYRVTENLDVTAGVRYSQERERLLPPVTDGKLDNQAVYVGTQFRF